MPSVTIKNARLSFPSLFKKAVFEGKDTKYEATFLFPKKDTKTYDAIIAAIDACKKANANEKVLPKNYFIKDGDEIFAEKDYADYEGMWVVKAANSKRPTVINRDKSPIVEEDEIMYSGCYVNAIIEPWSQKNAFGKKINSNLLGIQFVKDGTPLSNGGKVANVDEFDDIEEDDEDDL